MGEIAKAIRIELAKDDNPPIADFINTGILPYVVKLIDYDYFQETELMVELNWILSNVSSGTPEQTQLLITLEIIPRALNLLSHINQTVIENALWILANIAGDSLEKRDLLLEYGIVEKINQVLYENLLTETSLENLTWLISNLCRGSPYPNFIKVYYSNVYFNLL